MIKLSSILESNKTYTPVIKKNELYYYISSSEMIRFISINGPMDWNITCDYVRKYGICDLDEQDQIFWDENILKHPNEYNPEQVEWVTAFFESHPFLNNRMVLVFDN